MIIILIVALIIGVSLGAIFGLHSNTSEESSQQNQPEEQNPPENHGPQLVIPQIPLGTIGAFAATISAVTYYLIKKKRQ